VLLRVALRILRAADGASVRHRPHLRRAVGNLIDRMRFGAVVDFVDVHFRGWHGRRSTSPTRRSRWASWCWRSRCRRAITLRSRLSVTMLTVEPVSAGARLDRGSASG